MAENKKIPYKIYLEESEMPTQWYNVRADMKNKPAPLLNPDTLEPMKPEELENRHVERIPETLGDAIETYRDNAFIREVLGEHIYVKYLEAKEEEWRDFRAQVTDWEVNQYLYKY